MQLALLLTLFSAAIAGPKGKGKDKDSGPDSGLGLCGGIRKLLNDKFYPNRAACKNSCCLERMNVNIHNALSFIQRKKNQGKCWDGNNPNVKPEPYLPEPACAK